MQQPGLLGICSSYSPKYCPTALVILAVERQYGRFSGNCKFGFIKCRESAGRGARDAQCEIEDVQGLTIIDDIECLLETGLGRAEVHPRSWQ